MKRIFICYLFSNGRQCWHQSMTHAFQHQRWREGTETISFISGISFDSQRTARTWQCCSSKLTNGLCNVCICPSSVTRSDSQSFPSKVQRTPWEKNSDSNVVFSNVRLGNDELQFRWFIVLSRPIQLENRSKSSTNDDEHRDGEGFHCRMSSMIWARAKTSHRDRTRAELHNDRVTELNASMHLGKFLSFQNSIRSSPSTDGQQRSRIRTG